MTRSTVKQRIFLVGVPRSGTTLLQALLAAHPDVTSFTESHFFSRHFRTVPGLGTVLTKDPSPRVRAFLEENDAAPLGDAAWFGPPGPEVLNSRARRAMNTGKVARRLVGVLDEVATQRDASTWLEKTPRHLRYLDLIEGATDDGIPTRFVHIVRDGLQTVASLYRASREWERAYDVDECVARWNEDLAISASRIGSKDHLFVSYEQLTTDPERVLRELLEALSLSWDEAPLAGFGSAASAVVGPEESWKADVGRTIQPSATADDVLDQAQRTRVAAGLESGLYARVVGAALGSGSHD